MKYFQLSILVLLLLTLGCQSGTEYEHDFQNPKLTFDERLSDLLEKMTLEEKISQLNFESPAIDRLGIQEYNWWNECLHGVARSGIATVYPQAVGMAATFDTDLVKRVATSISDEGRAKYHDFLSKNKRGIYEGITFWTPNINIFRDPRWGRGMETYGECPHLTGEIGHAFIKGIQGDDPKYYKAIATSKHFAVHNGPESSRHSFNAVVSEHDLRNTYLPAFEKTVKESAVASIMCAYNRLDGDPCCGSSPLLNDILRSEWGFDGYVVTDCGAIFDFYNEGHHEVAATPAEAAAMAFINGTDINCGYVSPYLSDAVKQGLISENQIDVAVGRLLLARFQLGMFDPDEIVPFSSISYDVVDSENHKKLAEEAAKKSMVLLKNEDNILPLSKEVKKIAVIGPNSNDIEVLLANYNGIPSNPVTPLAGIRQKLPDAEVMYSLGCEHAEKLPTLKPIPNSVLFTDESLAKHGLKAEFYDTAGFERTPVHTRIDENVNFYWWDNAPYKDLDPDNFAAKWKGYLVPEETGEYAVGGEGFYHFEVHLDDSLIGSNHNVHHSLKSYTFLELEAGKAYKLEIKYYDIHGDANVGLLWSTPRKNYEQEALAIAEEADVVLLFMGLSPRLEGEEMPVEVEGFSGGDRIRIDLPDFQQEFIKKIHAVGKPTVLVLLNGSAISINWEKENIPAILEAWYPGQAAGTAIADILFGDYNPAGRLPLTYYQSVDDIPEFENYNMEGFTYRYFKGEPLYPFGYGMSYTTFEYEEPVLSNPTLSAGDTVTVSVTVSNSGEMDGEEVVQLYITDKSGTAPRPIKDLRGFERVFIKSGESKSITFELTAKDLAYWNIEKQKYLPTLGAYEVMVGGSSADDALLKTVLTVE